MMRYLVLVAGLAVAGCVPGGEPEPLPAVDACGAAALQGLVGQPARVLEAMRFARDVRIIRPGMAVTMDYSAERLNIEIDAAERIDRVACG